MALLSKFGLYLLILLAIPAVPLLMPILILMAFFGGLYYLISGQHRKQEVV